MCNSWGGIQTFGVAVDWIWCVDPRLIDANSWVGCLKLESKSRCCVYHLICNAFSEHCLLICRMFQYMSYATGWKQLKILTYVGVNSDVIYSIVSSLPNTLKNILFKAVNFCCNIEMVIWIFPFSFCWIMYICVCVFLNQMYPLC